MISPRNMGLAESSIGDNSKNAWLQVRNYQEMYLRLSCASNPLQRSFTKAPLQGKLISRTQTDHSVNPFHGIELLCFKRIGLIGCQGSLATNSAGPDIAARAIRPRITHKGTVLAFRYTNLELLALCTLPRLAVVDMHGNAQEIFDE